MRIIHLPYYQDNPYQDLLSEAQRERGHTVSPGGGGGRFLKTALFKWRADVLHFHWLHPYLLGKSWYSTVYRSCFFLFELFVLRLAGTKLIWTMHNAVSHDAPHVRTELFFQKLAARSFDAILVHSRHAMQLLIDSTGVNPERVLVYPHPHYPLHSENPLSQKQARTNLGIPEQDLVFLFLGRIQPYKGVERLITCFRRLEGTHLRLMIRGGCPDEKLKQLIQSLALQDSRIDLEFGHVGETQIEQYMAASDAVVFPFERILTSGSVVLACGYSRPVIAPDLGGLSELFSEPYPFLYQDGPTETGVDALEDTLRSVAASRAELSGWGKTCFEAVHESTWSGYAEVLDAMYSQSSRITVNPETVVSNLSVNSKIES
ncbi:MAG: glycosyltransferase family 4 protein [Planctomycetaceae bacterium]|nr:glycosyltransferase family 4 protein [Planctomycetaceae bacterium]